jgi:hypothetical protein
VDGCEILNQLVTIQHCNSGIVYLDKHGSTNWCRISQPSTIPKKNSCLLVVFFYGSSCYLFIYSACRGRKRYFSVKKYLRPAVTGRSGGARVHSCGTMGFRCASVYVSVCRESGQITIYNSSSFKKTWHPYMFPKSIRYLSIYIYIMVSLYICIHISNIYI